MKTTTYRVICADQKQKNAPEPISVLRVSPDGQPKYVLQLIHGISERKERFLPLMEYAASCGAEVILHDLPGHGNTAPTFAELGVMKNPGYDYANLRLGIDMVFASLVSADAAETEDGITVGVRDLDNMEFPDLPRYLLGFSMGALIAGIYAARQPDSLAGLILAGLPFRHKTTSLGIFCMNLLEGICGEEAKLKWLNKIAFSSYNRKFTPEPQSDGQFMWLSNDIDNRYEFLADPMCNHDKAVCTYTNLLRMVRDFHRASFWDMHRRDLPVQLMAGEFDPVAGGDKRVLASRRFLSDIGFRDVSALMYKGFRHEIFRDWGRENVFADVVRFCEDHLDAANERLDRIRAEYEPQFSATTEP